MWFQSTHKARRAAATRRRSSPYRPRLEALEDRCLLNAGALDPTFGNGAGYLTTSVGTTDASAQQVLLQPSGEIVLAGNSTISVVSKRQTYNVHEFTAVAYKPDGTLDTAFGSGGVVQQPFAGQGTFGANLWRVALEPAGPTGDNKIVLVGQDFAQGGLALMRLNPNGSLDTSFGGSGQVITQFQTSGNVNYERAEAVTVTSTGQIVALGSDQSYSWLLARYNPDGSLDSTFGSGGKATLVFSSSASGFHTDVESVAQQTDGKLVAAGVERWSNYPAAGTTWHGVVVRFNANGSLDTSFGNGGVVITALGSMTLTQNRQVAIYPNAGTANDGKIVVSGFVYTSTPWTGSGYAGDWAVERYNPDGSPDNTFGNGAGYVVVVNPQAPFGLQVASAVAIESDGKPIVVGSVPNANTEILQVARLKVDGSLDSSFGNGGLVTTPMLGTSIGASVALQPDGKIVAAGSSNTSGGKNEFAVARYLPSEPEIGSFTANPNPVTGGSSETLTVSNITDGNPNSTITQVAFYYYNSSGTKQILGYGTQTSPGVWTLTFTVNLTPGSYTVFAQAEDSDGVFGDPLSLILSVQ